MALQQLIYTSAAAKPLSEHELSMLLLGARNRNRNRGITGILLYHEGAFLQVLEGEASTVQRLFDSISRDPRHLRVTELLRRDIEVREFADWAMGFVAMKSVAAELPGYSRFFEPGGEASLGGSVARRLLEQFKTGRLRQHVER